MRTTKENTSSVLPLDEYDHIIVSYSGGKDSLASLLDIIEKGADRSKLEIWHQDIDGGEDDDKLMDWPVTRAYVKATGEALGIPVRFQYREGGFQGEMLRKDSPTNDVAFEDGNGKLVKLETKRAKNGTRMMFPQVSADLSVRWCSAYLKIDVAARAITNDPRFKGKKILMLTGERRQESTARSKYAEIEKHRTNTKSRRVDQWRNVIDWTEEEVWAIIERHRVRPHPAYTLGWGRVSCMACIFGDRNQWASVKKIAPDRFEKIANYEEQFGKTIKRGESVREQADQGQEFISDKPARSRLQAMGAIDFTADQFFLPDVEEWVMPSGAFQRCGGPT